MVSRDGRVPSGRIFSCLLDPTPRRLTFKITEPVHNFLIGKGADFQLHNVRTLWVNWFVSPIRFLATTLN